MFSIKNKFRILVACRANITRSAYLDGYFNKLLQDQYTYARNQIKIVSAGIEARKGSTAHEVVKHVAQLNGFSLRNHKSNPITRSIMKRVDVVLVMEQWQKDQLIKRYPFAREKIFILMEYLWHGSKEEILEVPDPTGKNTEDYHEFITIAHQEAERILHEVYRQDVF